MDLKLLTHLCRMQAEIYHLPIHIYENGQPAGTFEEQETPFAIHEFYRHCFSHNRKKVDYLLTSQFLMFGYIRIYGSGLAVMMGPAIIGNATESDARSILHEAGLPVHSRQSLQQFCEYLQHLPDLSFEMFLHLLCLEDGFLNQEITEINTLTRHESPAANAVSIEKELLNKNQDYVDHPEVMTDHGYETRIAFYIENGMTRELPEYMRTITSDIGRMGNTALRHAKNALIVLNSMALRAAIRGGVNADIGYKLGSVYLEQIESCQEIGILTSLSEKMLTDYCNRVKESTAVHTGHPLLRQVLWYISEHLHQKITISEIASAAHVTPEYLSCLFHKETGETLINYISRQKVQEARQLLALTQMPLSEIAQYLAFSTQSYFQTVFKKNTGTTPELFRQKYYHS